MAGAPNTEADPAPGPAADPALDPSADTAVDTDVVVVGAGPVGLLLAGELRLGGARVTVLEQLTEPTTESRASTLHTRTMEILEERGLLARLGTLPSGGPGHFGGMRLDLTAADPGHRWAGQWKCAQARLESLLHDWATELGARVLRGHVVTGLRPRTDRIEAGFATLGTTARGTGTGLLSASYLVGCDGERSTVRQLAGFEVAGQDGALEMLRADVAGIDIPDRRFERLPNGLATAHRWPDGSTRVMVHVYGSGAARRTGPPSLAEVAAAWKLVTGEDIGAGTPVWLNAFDNTSLQAARYVKGRVLLAGDAAHAQMPVGGQALNLGLQDAADLGPKLAARITGQDPAAPDGAGSALLESYHATRHRIGAATLTNIQAQARLLLGGPEVDGLRAVFGDLLTIGPARRHLARAISGLGHADTTTEEPTPREAAA
ncbi:oxygenase/bifunctional oxygenase/reductase [Actinacidiphila alni]|uniref:Oxygenase/bifunctional oxygenase/reductase n=1 Tax=Actinacidiphila alni TaxID=380248 RepID=A0A1I2CFQ4_9ACTN|nr:FAD-dependent monooxygenase [Actinacidiphila alni]SFE67197.1 oxygenase/bifunctional oxygenase/reductase [Actinacidiphila alni]